MFVFRIQLGDVVMKASEKRDDPLLGIRPVHT